ncbi:MAG: FHA domain-containing protein [Prevotellaceae bacterium]|nr:FHA domain-containing protein [Prevotellaceae bacterium]
MDKTVQYKRTLNGSVGAGVSALFNGKGRRYYILEHKDASKYHKAGESQKIIIDQVELGRDSSCQIRFDESFETVSRRHAAIVKEGDKWKLVQLSKTNSTLLNGRNVETEWYLENGDEIQLSIGGPRMGFIVPAGKQSLVSSIRMTERLELFRKQALRPYKTAIACLAIILVISIGGLGAWNIVEHNKWLEYQAEAKNTADSLRNGISDTNAKIIAYDARHDSINNADKERYNFLRGKTLSLSSAIGNFTAQAGIASDAALKTALKSVYYIRVEKVNITWADGSTESIVRGTKGYNSLFWSGSGFLLNDGRFITARHVVDGIKFISSLDEKSLVILNNEINNGGKVEFVFGAYSPSHSFTFTNNQCVMNSMNDKTGICEVDYDKDGIDEKYKITIADAGEADWACIYTSFKGSIIANPSISKTLKQQTKLVVLGYPNGYYADNIKALQGSCMVATDGLHNGVIVITERNFEHGNSGGPVLRVKADGTMEAIGIISAGYGDTVGFIVPISNVN